MCIRDRVKLALRSNRKKVIVHLNYKENPLDYVIASGSIPVVFGCLLYTSVSGVTKNQIFVEIDKGIEGAVLVRTLEDYYNYDEKRRMLVGEKTNEVFKLGKKLIVKLVSVSVELRQITFEIVGKQVIK